MRTAVLDQHAEYSVNRRALSRWANERLSMNMNEDGSFEALFRYDGTTCTNMGRPLTFNYNLKLGSRAEGYPILEPVSYTHLDVYKRQTYARDWTLRNNNPPRRVYAAMIRQHSIVPHAAVSRGQWQTSGLQDSR